MDEELHPALLPVGLRDILPPDAGIEADIVRQLMTTLDLHGYERVKPPIIEFETSLLTGPGAAMAQDTFRLMDPVSHRMIGLRADMTLQIARIATSRLVKSPRPLRLSYAGQVLRVSGGQLGPERQLGQVGAELIGADLPAADAEIIGLAAEALTRLGVEGLSVDLTLPPLVPGLLKSFEIAPDAAARIRQALDHKDIASVKLHGGVAAPFLIDLMAAAGPAERAIAAIGKIALPGAAAAEFERLRIIVSLVHSAYPDLVLTVDPVENRGFEYHTGVSFTLFARQMRGELGRGGRYRAGIAPHDEASTGFTLYTETVLTAVEPPPRRKRIYLPFGTSKAAADQLRDAGWATIAALTAADPALEAKRLGAGYILGAAGPAAV